VCVRCVWLSVLGKVEHWLKDEGHWGKVTCGGGEVASSGLVTVACCLRVLFFAYHSHSCSMGMGVDCAAAILRDFCSTS
jgi:hypothetical protein